MPEKVVSYNVYIGENRLVGISGEVTLPNFEAMTSTISGAGILGEYESATIGHFGSQTIEIPFRTLQDQSFSLAKLKGESLILRAAQQSYDVAGGGVNKRPLKITLRGQPKGLNLGTLAVGGATGTTNTLEILYIKIEENNRTMLEFDKLNYVYIVDGEDLLADIRNMI